MESVTTSRGGRKVIYESYCYTLAKGSNVTSYWKCTQIYKHGCKGSLQSNPDLSNPVVGTPHNHAPDHAEVELNQVRNSMKQDARSSRENP